jgi:Cdc6-like AAA superfamily ATPase
MSIPKITEDDLRKVLAENLTPSDTIKTPDRLFGRASTLKIIDRALNSPGRQIFIYGDRGVGKTSLALTAAFLHTGVENMPIYVFCGRTSKFGEIIQAIGNNKIPIQDRMEPNESGGGFNFSLPGGFGGIGFTGRSKTRASVNIPQTLSEAYDVIRYVAAERRGTTMIVVDEMERIESEIERQQFAEFIKNLPELQENVRFIFCGIAQDINELLQAHPSAGRILENIKLERLHHSDLWQILTAVAQKLNIEVQQETLTRIGQISDGFPHYVHLIGESLFWSMFDDAKAVGRSGATHFKAGIEGALQRTEATLRAQYDKAIHKTRNTDDYEEALWALADSTADRRQITEIYSSSYSWISGKRSKRPKMTREQLNQRYLSLRKESHGRIVAGYGSGWFAFRESIMRGYVRLRGEAKDINLGRHLNTAGMD